MSEEDEDIWQAFERILNEHQRTAFFAAADYFVNLDEVRDEVESYFQSWKSRNPVWRSGEEPPKEPGTYIVSYRSTYLNLPAVVITKWDGRKWALFGKIHQWTDIPRPPL